MLCLTQIEQQLRVTAPQLSAGEGWDITIPGLHIKNGCNLREHWAARAKRVKRERFLVGQALWARELLMRRQRPGLPCVVTITRVAPRMLDSDNAVAGCKGVRDEIAAWLGINDNDPRVTWQYAQEKSKLYACNIQIEEAK